MSQLILGFAPPSVVVHHLALQQLSQLGIGVLGRAGESGSSKATSAVKKLEEKVKSMLGRES